MSHTSTIWVILHQERNRAVELVAFGTSEDIVASTLMAIRDQYIDMFEINEDEVAWMQVDPDPERAITDEHWRVYALPADLANTPVISYDSNGIAPDQCWILV